MAWWDLRVLKSLAQELGGDGGDQHGGRLINQRALEAAPNIQRLQINLIDDSQRIPARSDLSQETNYPAECSPAKAAQACSALLLKADIVRPKRYIRKKIEPAPKDRPDTF